MAPSRKARRGKMSRRSRGKKSTRRARKQKQRGGGEYVLTFDKVPAAGNPAPAGLGDLGTYAAGNQSFTIATTKPIKDIRFFKADGVTELGVGSFGGSKIGIQIGTTQNIVPSTVKLRGGTAMNPAVPKSGNISVKGLNTSSLNLLGGVDSESKAYPQGFVMKIATA